MAPPIDAQSPRDGHARALAHAIQREAAETAFWTGRSRFSDRVIDAVARVAREAFIPDPVPLGVAYANRPQSIGHGQTISQPYIVALMTDLLDLQGGERVLEIGTGSGYQAAILAELGADLYSVERLEALADHARTALERQGFSGVHIKCGDGTLGWAEHAPYDAIVVTAAVDGPIPKALIEQLAPGGRMVIPQGPHLGPQMLLLGRKDAQGDFTSQAVLPVSFVPLVSLLENQRKQG
ncbi:protein-L-isoaspartate(D-aspartate) O-methyltransferase [Magnetovibrio sp.]|uniref:protein-L-isoaspartate(D-aspartate) O-methyltransferase n=1 Tax=Magnetovibrio sp. TaxID=2024836 RepID=UPI002F932213